MTIKVFRMNDYDWYAAETLEQAVAHAQEQTGEAEVADEPYEVSDQQLNYLKFLRDDGTTVSFREELKSQIKNMTNESFPHLFASTEF